MQSGTRGSSCSTLPRPSAPTKSLPFRLEEASMVMPFSASRQAPAESKFSSDNPIGSICEWQEWQVGLVAWASRRWRTVLRVGLLTSLTSEKSTLGGGGGVGEHSKMSSTALPRSVGEERPGWEN